LKVNRERTGDETTNSNLFLFDEGNIIGKYDVSLGTKATRFNQVKLVHFDRNQSYQSNIIYYANSTYLTQDNDTVIERDMDLALVTDPRQATYLAALALNQSRFSMAISFTASFAALQVEVGDIVRVTTGNLGFDEKLFRILSIGLNVDGTVKLDGVEYDDTLYTPGTLPEIPLVGTVTAETGSSLYTPVMAPPTNVVATASKSTQTDGTILAAIDVSWDAVSGAVSYEITQTGTSSAIYVTTGNTYKIENLPNGTYNVGVASVNSYGSKSVKAY
jgi:predicted phage tail protein